MGESGVGMVEVLDVRGREAADESGRPYCEQCGKNGHGPQDLWLVVEQYDDFEWEEGVAIGSPLANEPMGAFCSPECLRDHFTELCQVDG